MEQIRPLADSVATARPMPLDDHYVELIKTLCAEAHEARSLSTAEAEFVLLAIGPICEELLQRRRVMRTIATVAETPSNVVYLTDQGGAS